MVGGRDSEKEKDGTGGRRVSRAEMKVQERADGKEVRGDKRNERWGKSGYNSPSARY